MSLLLNKQTISANNILVQSTTQNSTILYITSNIGIGTTQALQTLQVQGQSYFSSNVGIGTTNPQAILHINGNLVVIGNITSSGSTIQSTVNTVSSAGTLTLYPTILFDSRNASFTATLPDASIGYIITLQLLTRKSLPVTITMSKGTFILTSTNMTRQLVYTANGWQNYTSTINSFFPTVQQGTKLVGSGYTGTPRQGWSVSLSADGNTLAAGGQNDNSSIGATWVFIRSGTTWTQQGTKLVGSGYTGTPSQGTFISLSADGNTLAVGGNGDNGYIGATWIFTRSGTNWSQQGSKLVGTGYSGNSFQGISIALSSDSNTLAVGGYTDNATNGAVWIFTRSGTTWTQQGTKLLGTGYSGASRQGWSVALSVDGNTLAIGGQNDNSGIGASWVFTRSGSTWTQQGTKLIGTGYSGNSTQGQSVALSSNGNTLAIGGNGDNGSIGASWVFTRSGTTWTQQGTKLIGSGYVGTSEQGISISLSSDGNTLSVGGSVDNSSTGAVWIFNRSALIWSQTGTKIVGTGYTGSPQQTKNSLSSDGNTLAVGGWNDSIAIGAVWVFV